MISKEQLLASMKHECAVIRHLATRVPDGTLDYRPTPGQRSTLELLCYLCHCSIIPARYCLTDSWDHAESYVQRHENLTLAGFEDAMLEQERELEGIFAELSDEDLAERDILTPWGTPTKLGAGLMDMALKCLVAYRMQLFLYAKACGAELGPSNCWMGADARG